MFLGDYDLGDDLVFYVQAVDTAGSVDNATGVPSYDIFQDEVGGGGAVTVANGNMGGLGGDVGLYSATVALVGPAFVVGAVYVIRVVALVDGENPGVVMFFRIRPSPFIDQIWKRQQPVNPDPGAMEDIKTDTDNLDFVGKEG